MLRRALELSDRPVRLYASAWSAPAWMKSNNAINGQGFLLPEYYGAWARYHVLFLQAYQAAGLLLWGLTAQNEPLDGNIPGFTFNCMGWNASSQAEWVGRHLGPALDQAGFGDLKILAFDDQRPLLAGWASTVMADSEAARYVAGWAVHWYVDWLGAPGVLDQVHAAYPDKMILFSEACTGSFPWDLQKVLLGSWERCQE